MKFLEDDVIRLRAVEPRDAEILWEVETDSNQWRDNGMMAPYSRHNLEEYAKNYDADPIRSGQIRLIIERKEDKKIVGITDLYDISALGRTAFLAVYVLRDERRQGLARRAITQMEKYAHVLLNLRVLCAKVSAENQMSQQMFPSMGYEKCGELPEWLYNAGHAASLLLFAKKLGKN